MTDAPEMIWASPSVVPEDQPDWSCGEWSEATEWAGSRDRQYIRADIHEAEIERLRGALRPLAALPIGDATPDDAPLYGLDGFYITHGDIRRAKAIINKETGDD